MAARQGYADYGSGTGGSGAARQGYAHESSQYQAIDDKIIVAMSASSINDAMELLGTDLRANSGSFSAGVTSALQGAGLTATDIDDIIADMIANSPNDGQNYDAQIIAAMSASSINDAMELLGADLGANSGSFSAGVTSALQGAGLTATDIDDIIADMIANSSNDNTNDSNEFDSMANYLLGAVQGFLEMQGLTDISNLDVAMDEQDGANSFHITADSYTFNSASVTGLDITWSFDSTDQLTTLTGTGIDTLGVAAINEESIEMWYQYSDPDSGDDYARMAVEELLKQIGITNYNNVVASASLDEDGKDNITINLDQDVTYGSEEFYIYEIKLTFKDGSIESKTFDKGLATEIKNAFSDATLDVWYEYSGPDQQRQHDQQEGGYYDDDASHKESFSNVWTWTDEQGVTWTVVDKDVDGVWSSTQTGSNGDTRTQASSWNHSTQTNSFTETYVSTSRGIDSTMVEASGPNGATKTYTGTADGIGWMPLHGLYTSLNVVETLDQYWNTTNITGSGVNSDGDTVAFTYADYELKIDGESIQMDFGFDDFFKEDQGSNEWEWTDDWNNTIWVVVEGNVNDVWTMSETAWSMDGSGNKDALTGDTRTSFSSWNNDTQTNTWTMTEVSADKGFNFTRVEVYNEIAGTSTETITGTFDQIGWYFLGQTYEGISAVVNRDSNWNVLSITGIGGEGTTATVQDPANPSATLDVTFANNDILIGGESVSDMQDNQNTFQEGGSTWTWTDWDGTEWTVVDEQIGDVWTSTETSSNNDVRTHTSSWDDTTNSSTMVETYASGNLEQNFTRTEIYNSDGTSSETITGTTNQLGWMRLDGIYDNVNVTIAHTWDGMTLTGAGTSQASGLVVAFTLDTNENLLIDGTLVEFGDDMDFNMNENQSWESEWEWTDFDNTVWVVTDTQEGEKWSSTEIQYTDNTKATATGAERTHSSTWNERTQTNIWTDSEKSIGGLTDFTRVETQRADGTSSEKITGKTDKFGDYDYVEITISRDSNWNVTKISGTVQDPANPSATLAVTSDESGNILIGGVAVDTFNKDASGGHANMETSESSWTWTDWDGVTWTVTDKQEGDTWTSTETGSNGDIRIHKNSWNGDTETWSDTFTSADGSIDVTRVEVRNSTNNTSTETITGKDNHFGWWDFPTAYEDLVVTIERDSNWNITDVSGTASGGVTFGFTDGGLTIGGVAYQSGGDNRSNLMQEAFVNTWTWEDGNGVTWTVTDKQDGDTWTSTEEGSNGDVRINSSSWDSDIDNYVNTTSYKSGSDTRDYSIREIWTENGSTEYIKGATDQINWVNLGEIYTDVDVTIVRNQNWDITSLTGTGTDSDNNKADFGWDTDNYQLTFDGVMIEGSGYGGDYQEQDSWESTWEWTDWEGVLWTVVESQVGDVWTSTETGSNGAKREFKSSWDSVKQISVWSESYDEDSSVDATEGGHIDFTRVETYSPNGTSTETITGSTDNIAWMPLHGIYTNVSVTIDRDASWKIYKVTGTGKDTDGVTAAFSWSNDQITFGDNNIENAADFKVNDDQYWENTSTWDDHDGTTWQVTEIQDGNTYTRTEVNATRGDTRTESNVWDHDTQTNTRTMHETNTDRGIDVNEVSIWNGTTETETRTISGTTDHIDWMPLNGATPVAVTLTYDAQHNITAANGTVTIDGTAKTLTFDNGQFLFDGAALTVQWTDEWDQTVWTMTQTQDENNTTTRTETATAGPREGAEHVSTHSWNHVTQIQTSTETSKDKDGNTITNVTKVQTFTEGGGSSEVITGSTNHLDWMQLGEIYTALDLTITRDGDWNIKSIDGTGTNANGDLNITIGFSPTDNMLIIGGNLVAGDAIGQTSESTWEWQDGDGVTWTVVDKQSGDTWKSTETGDNGDVRIMESTWDDTAKTNTWSESYTNAGRAGIKDKDILDYTKTEVYDENSGTSTMTTTGTSDHIGWMYLGEIYTKMNITETRGTDWNTTDLSGAATNEAGKTVSFDWEGGEIIVDGDVLSIHGKGDFGMSADNFQNEWTYFDHDGIEWTVVESQLNDAWISEETNEYGDVRTNSNYWDNDTQESKNVTEFKSADGGIDFKMTEVWSDDGSSVLTVTGDTDHIGWDYVGEVFTDIDVVITRGADWSISSVLASDGGAATATNAANQVLALSYNQYNDITIDGMSIYQMGDDFYKDFDQDTMDQLGKMGSGSREYTYTNDRDQEVTVIEESMVTDIIGIKTDVLDINLVFDLGEGDGMTPGAGVSVKSANGVEGLAGFDYVSLTTFYTAAVLAAETELTEHDEAAENAFFLGKVEEYLDANSISKTDLEVTFDIADTFTTKETTAGGGVWLMTRTMNVGSETEREENFNSTADFNTNNPHMWTERIRSYEDSETGFKEISVETSSFGEDFTKTLNYASDGTVTMVAVGTKAMGPDMLMSDIYVTSVLEDGWKYTNLYGTGVIKADKGEMAAMNGMTAVITSAGTDQYGGPLIKLTVEVSPGVFQEIDMYQDGADRQAQMHNEGNPLDRYIIEEGEGFASSKNSVWDEVTFDNATKGTTTFTGTFTPEGKAAQSISVTEVRTFDQGGMLEEIVQTVTSTRGSQGESYTRTYTLNERFDVKIELSGTKVIRGETYSITEMNTEITPNGDVRIEGYGKKLDGTNVDFFKGHQDPGMEISSINRDGTVQKLTEEVFDADDSDAQGPINEIMQWSYNDHNGTLWTVLDQFDGQTRTSTETTAAGDSRTMKDTWSNDGSYSFEMTEAMVGQAVFVESRSGTPGFENNKYQEVETVLITEGGVTIESYTQTTVFEANYTSTRTLEGTVNFIGKIYTEAKVVITQDANWVASKVEGTAKDSSGKDATFDMEGTHPWGDPKIVVTVDGTAITDTRTVIGGKDVNNANDPVALADSESINQNQAIVIDVVDNDTDADGDTLSIKSIGDASYGSVSLASGKIIYTPDYGYSGNDKFTYTVTDGKGGTDQGTVSITVTGVNSLAVAVDDSYTFTQGSGKVVLDVLANDTDAEDDELSLYGVFPSFPPTKTAESGKVSVFGGIVNYSPVNDDFAGEDTFVYYVTDGAVDGNGDIIYDEGSVTITYEALNKAPVAVADTITLAEDVDSVLVNVLTNDFDEDNVVIGGSFVIGSSYTIGSIGTTDYTLIGASANTVGTMFTATGVGSGTGTVFDGSDLSIDSFTNPSSGTATLMGGSLFYSPDENFSGSDSMTYKVTDPSGGSDSGTVTFTVTEVNDAPLTVDDVLNIQEGSADGITVNLLSNDNDREDDAFALTSIGTASNGTAVNNEVSGGSFVTDTTYTIASIGTTDYKLIGASANTVGTVFTATGAGSGTGTVFDGTVTYTPGKNEDGSNYTGSDTFSYTVKDVNGAEATGTVSITVSVINGVPVAVADTSIVSEDSSSNRISVLTNDTDPESNTLSLDSVSTASYGTIALAGNIALYTPEANFAGSDSFSYWVTDGEGGSTKGTVSITVTAANDAPTAVDDTLGTISATRPTTLDLLANDTDPDGDALTISAVGEATYGNVTISGTSVRFNATRGSSGKADSFTYTIKDGDGETSTATVNFTISANTNPNAINDKKTYLEDGAAAEIEVLVNDTDSDGDQVTVLSINTDPKHGTASVTNGKVFYAPTSNYNGTDSFTYIIKDGQGGRDEATVAITITSVNDAPAVVNDTITVDAGSTANVVKVLDNDSDVDADDISISSITEPLHGTATLTAGVLTYAPEAGYTGSDSFSYNASDGTDESTGKVNITVSAGNTLPTVVADTATILEDSKNQLVDVLANDTDTDKDELSIASVTQGASGTVSLSGGSVFYTPDANFTGKDNFTYTITDGNGGQSSGGVVMTVTAVEDDPTAVNDTLDPVEAGSGKIVVDLISNDSDADGDVITISAVGAAQYGTTTYALGTIYYQPGNSVKSDIFSYTLTDANDNEVTGYASVEIIAANNSPTGAVTITGGTQPYQTLTVSNTVADSDGITGDFSYQWYADGTAITGETATTYTISLEDVGTAYSVKASYTDDVGNAESKTSDAANAVTKLDQPFSFVASKIVDGILTLTLKADVEAIYSRSDITSLTGADLSLDMNWDLFATLDGSDAKYSISTLADDLIILESSSTSTTGTFDTLTLASLRLTAPLLTLVDTDDATTSVGTTDNLILVTLKPVDSSVKLAISLSGTIESNQGQVSFSQYDATTSNITGVTANSDPEGSVTISGTVAVDEVLTASHSLTDIDGMRAVSYQWLNDGVAITNATNSTYTITTADINAALSVQASYTDGGGTAEAETSSGKTVAQTTTNKPFMFTSELITASEASIALYGADYSVDANETILKLTLNGDITRFDTDNSILYTSVAGAELNLSLDWTKFEAIQYNDSTSETFEINKDYTGKLFLGMVTNDNGEFSKIVFSSLNTSAKPVLTLVDSVTSSGRGETDRPTEVDLATIYLNPIDTVKDVEITFGGAVSVNQGGDTFTQLSHSLEVVTKTYDAIISTAATDTTITKLTGTSVNLWKDGADTGTSVAVDSGEISIASTVTFDTVKLSVTDAYDFDINISDAIDVLRHIVDLEALTPDTAGYHAADVDNNGAINISDAIDILRHIVDLEAIDTFDVLDSAGARVTTLDADATGEAPTWTLVANGDVDMSGSYDDDYLVTVDIA